jgi:hypothetical protein
MAGIKINSELLEYKSQLDKYESLDKILKDEKIYGGLA